MRHALWGGIATSDMEVLLTNQRSARHSGLIILHSQPVINWLLSVANELTILLRASLNKSHRNEGSPELNSVTSRRGTTIATGPQLSHHFRTHLKLCPAIKPTAYVWSI